MPFLSFPRPLKKASERSIAVLERLYWNLLERSGHLSPSVGYDRLYLCTVKNKKNMLQTKSKKSWQH